LTKIEHREQDLFYTAIAPYEPRRTQGVAQKDFGIAGRAQRIKGSVFRIVARLDKTEPGAYPECLP